MIDTQHETISPAPPAPPGTPAAPSVVPAPSPPSRRHRWWAVPLTAAAIALLLIIGVTSVLSSSLTAEKLVPSEADPAVEVLEPTPYARVPAAAEPVDDRVSFGELEGIVEVDEDRTGSIYFVTIREPAQTVLSSWIGEREPEILQLTELEKFGRVTPTQQRRLSLQMMRTASQVAQFVALRQLGFEEAQLVPGDVVVADLVCLEVGPTDCTTYAPADESLDPGDRIVSIDGVALTTVDDLVAELADNDPGDVVTLEIERDEGEPDSIDVPLIASPDDPERTIIGFIPFDTSTVELPFEIDIDTGRIGGPSAGLAFTLTLIDELSEGDLLGGLDVAVTGEIDIDGNVGAIGGLPQKASAVKQVGVDHFIVPASQSPESLEQARAVAGDDLEIIPVATLTEALAALERLGGDPLPA
ncbi:MAG: S16 family serine protease [Ilumatobacteraceae bacterium]